MNTRIPPQDIQAEEAVLGAMLIEPNVIPGVTSILNPQSFYYDSHRRIYEAMLTLSNQHKPIDLITVSGFLGDQVSAADIAGMAGNALPSNVQAHAQAVKEAEQKRRLLESIRQAEDDLYEPTENSLGVAGRLSSALSLMQEGSPGGFLSLAEAVTGAVKDIEKAYERKDSVLGVPTGLRDLDNPIGGDLPR